MFFLREFRTMLGLQYSDQKIWLFAGVVELWLEQEGEAQLCTQCCGFHTQVQPGERDTHTHMHTHTHI